MVDYTRNPFFNSPYIEQTGNNLIKAFNDDGHAEENRARTDLLKAQTADTAGKTAGREGAASAIQGQDFSGPISNQFWANIGAQAVRSGQDPAHIAAAVQFLRANSHASDSDIAAAVVGHMGGSGIKDGVSIGDRDTIVQKKEDNANSRNKYSADSSAGATIGAANIHEAGADRRNLFNDQHSITYQFGDDNQPHMITKSDMLKNPNNKPVLPNNYYEKGVDANNKPVYAPPGSGNVAPVIADHFVQTEDPNKPGSNIYKPVTDNLPAPAPKVARDPNATPGIVDQVELNVLNNLGAYDAANKRVDPAFQKQNGANMAAAKIAAGETYRKTGDSGKAEAAYLQALGIQPGSSFEPPGIISRTFGSGQGTIVPPAGASTAPAGTAQAAPSIATQFGATAPGAAAPAIPPVPTDKGQLKVDTVYQTARGPARWNGKNFDPVGQQNANDGAR